MNKTSFDTIYKQLIVRLNSYSREEIDKLLACNIEQVNITQGYKPSLFVGTLARFETCMDDISLCRKALLVGFIRDNWHKLTSVINNNILRKEYEVFFERVYSQVIAVEGVYSENTDVFWKDLAIARMQMFPVKAGFVEFYSGFGIKQGLSFNPLQTYSFTKLLLKHGRKPYYHVHTHTPLLNNFSPDGWAESYKQIAAMLNINTHIKGIIRGSWFFDPKLKDISPHLSYLLDLPLANGAKLFCVGKDTSGNAFAKSKSRLKLFNEGKYTPMLYLLVWPRDDMIAWFESNVN